MIWVWLIISALFALMHGVNVPPWRSVWGHYDQVAITFPARTAFYISRRMTGSLASAMLKDIGDASPTCGWRRLPERFTPKLYGTEEAVVAHPSGLQPRFIRDEPHDHVGHG